MSEQHFTFGAVSPKVAMIKLDGEPLNVRDVVVCLNRLCDKIKEQQATIEQLEKELASVCVQKSLLCDELEILKKVIDDE